MQAAPPGALERLCEPGEHVRDGFRRRRNDTLGVVATSESAIKTSLVIRKRDPGRVPPDILKHIAEAHRGRRPDLEELIDQVQMSACARQLSAGFYHYWRFPWTAADADGDDARRALIDEWFKKRQAFNRELRERLQHPREHLDSPALCVRAAIRWYEGYTYRDPSGGHRHTDACYRGHQCAGCDSPDHSERVLICSQPEGARVEVKPFSRRGLLPTWESEAWPEWHEVHDKVKHATATRWISDFVVCDAAKWLQKEIGIAWVEFPELGERIAREAGVPWFGGGSAASEQIALESGERSIVASIKAHGTGKNLQAFSRNLIVTPPTDGGTYEQLLGRTHRPGQRADSVEVALYQHTEDYRTAFAKAREYARFIQQTDGQPQKLLFADYEWAA